MPSPCPRASQVSPRATDGQSLVFQVPIADRPHIAVVRRVHPHTLQLRRRGDDIWAVEERDHEQLARNDLLRMEQQIFAFCLIDFFIRSRQDLRNLIIAPEHVVETFRWHAVAGKEGCEGWIRREYPTMNLDVELS